MAVGQGAQVHIGWSKPEVCDCGRWALTCAACEAPITEAEGYGLDCRGMLCTSCYGRDSLRRGRQCNRCVRRLRDEHDGPIGFGNGHPMRHSSVLGICVDREMVAFLEGFNQNVAPTWVSCQGVPALPNRAFRWAEAPYIGLKGEHQTALLEWADSNSAKYGITELAILDQRDRFHRLIVRFSEVPKWLG